MKYSTSDISLIHELKQKLYPKYVKVNRGAEICSGYIEGVHVTVTRNADIILKRSLPDLLFGEKESIVDYQNVKEALAKMTSKILKKPIRMSEMTVTEIELCMFFDVHRIDVHRLIKDMFSLQFDKLVDHNYVLFHNGSRK